MCLKQQQLWLQVTEKKEKPLKWIKTTIEAETTMANNPFLVSLHNVSGQRTRERKIATAVVEQKDKYQSKKHEIKRDSYVQKCKKQGTERGESGSMCVSVWTEWELFTQTENGPLACSAHRHTAAHWQNGVLIGPFFCNTKTLQMCAS